MNEIEIARRELGGSLAQCMQASPGVQQRFEITGDKAAVEGSFIRTHADTAAAALRIARDWAQQGIHGIMITNPKGESYALDRFGMIASAKEGSDRS
jgi:hypothetical protein